MEDKLKALMQELGNAINESLSDSDRIAAAIAEHISPVGEIPEFAWKPQPRIDAQRAKFTATIEELGVPATVLDDSVFLLKP